MVKPYKNKSSIEIYTNRLSVLDDTKALDFLLSLRIGNKSHITDAKIYIEKFGGFSNVIDAALNNPLEKIIKEEHAHYLRLPHEIANKYLSGKLRQNPIINSPESLVSYLNHSMRGLEIEHFKVIYLNGRNMFIADEYISKGSIATAVIYPREVIKSALKHNAAALIFAHNHPSGNPKPSQDDLKITKKLCDAANLLDIQVHDHLIVAGNDCYSFAENGLMD